MAKKRNAQDSPLRYHRANIKRIEKLKARVKKLEQFARRARGSAR